MRVVKKAFAHVGTVIKGMLFIGFTVQILLGLAWMCRNFGQVQNFGEPDSALYKGLFRLLGEIPQLMYLLQLGAAFLAGDFFLGSFSGSFLGSLVGEGISRNGKGRFWSLWRALALLTYPFAMQCHMAVLPFSFMGSLFLVMLSFMMRLSARGRIPFRREPSAKIAGAASGMSEEPGETANGMSEEPGETVIGMSEEPGETAVSMSEGFCKTVNGMGAKATETARRVTAETEGAAGGNPVRRRGQAIAYLALAAVCAGVFALLSGAVDASGREEPGRGIEAALASRFAWPTIWYDQGSWTDELREAVEDVLWEASYYPENMALLQSALEERVGAEAAGTYYREIAEVAWRNHAPMIIRQVGWDILGYTVTPVIFQLQLRGEAYDSYTGRNYEIMRGNTPVLTRNYVNYGCWWFTAAFVLSLLSLLCLPVMKKTAPVKEAVSVKEAAPMKAPAGVQGLPGIGKRLAALAGPVMICIVCSGILVGLLTLRGAGLMDYKYTALISQLWILPALFLSEDKGVSGKY